MYSALISQTIIIFYSKEVYTKNRKCMNLSTGADDDESDSCNIRSTNSSVEHLIKLPVNVPELEYRENVVVLLSIIRSHILRTGEWIQYAMSLSLALSSGAVSMTENQQKITVASRVDSYKLVTCMVQWALWTLTKYWKYFYLMFITFIPTV